MRHVDTNERTGIVTDIYPVGWLRTLLFCKRLSVNSKRRPLKRVKLIKIALRARWIFMEYCIKEKKWHDLKNCFNGYLAEHRGCRHNAGHAWSQKRALAQVERICEIDSWAKREAEFGDPRTF